MADLADVEDALVLLISGGLYPDGPNNSSIVGADCRVHRGWPMQSGLNSDLAAGIVNVTVFSSSRSGKLLSPLPIVYAVDNSLPAFSASAAGTTANFTGTPAHGHCAGLLVDNSTYVYRPKKGASAGMVAASLVDLVRADRIVHLSGTSITVPGAIRLAARVVADQVSAREVRRQEREIVVACWCSSPAQRDIICRTIDSTLAGAVFVPMPDGSSARLSYVDTAEYDQAQNSMLYRRDLVFAAEYPTITLHNDPSMLFGVLHLGAVDSII